MASMKDIKTRIRSVESTQQITRAMELVATSKLRHARERVERSRPFHEVLGEAIAGIQAGLKETPSVYSEVRPVKKTCFVVIGGDRGLAGGYNANLHRLVLSLAGSEPYCVLPIGKKPLEQFTRSGAELVSTYFGLAASVGIGDCMQIARLLCDGFAAGRYDRVTVVYTEFRSMLSQVPASADVLRCSSRAMQSTRARPSRTTLPPWLRPSCRSMSPACCIPPSVRPLPPSTARAARP